MRREDLHLLRHDQTALAVPSHGAPPPSQDGGLAICRMQDLFLGADAQTLLRADWQGAMIDVLGGSPALDAPCLSREARAAQLTLEVMELLAEIASWPGSVNAPAESAVTIPIALCRKASMALRLMAKETPDGG